MAGELRVQGTRATALPTRGRLYSVGVRSLAYLSRALCVFLVACRPASGLPTVNLTFTSPTGEKTQSFLMEVAATQESRTRGLMFRRSLDSDKGMLFLFPKPGRLSFWMKNTFIPLDMVFVSSDWRVVGSLENVPPQTETPRMVEADSQYVLEFAAGTVKRLGVLAGARVDVEGELPAVR
jgi:uncharacterized membrane protein (UPF0127 family)